MRKLLLLVVAMATLVFVPAAMAVPPTDVLDGDVACGVVTNEGSGDDAIAGSLGQTWCGTSGGTNATTTPALPGTRSTAITFDDMPIDVNVAFPDEADAGDGPYPLVMMFHGYGGAKMNFRAMQRWLTRGYAVYSQTNRGFHQSCGNAGSVAADPTGCADQYVRLIDNRYEVRDAQLFSSKLVDENLVLPSRIAATGGSYGGGMSMALAALNSRTAMPDGTLVPWESPGGEDLDLAVATPNIPWTDLAYSLVPNGSTLDYLKDSPYSGRFGVKKESYVNLLYNGGNLAGRYSPAGEQPANDLAGWMNTLNAGEPYDGNPAAEAMLDEITTNHSSYYIDHSVPPAPLLISSGFTDDLFPADEATRFYNRTRAQHPDSPLSLFFGSFGHSRGQNKADTLAALRDLENRWIDYYLADVGSKPASDVTAYKQTCPNDAPAGAGFNAGDWASISPGEVRLTGGAETQEIAPNGGDAGNAVQFDPNGGFFGACAKVPGGKEPGTANYEMDPAPAGGFTMLGSPTIMAKIQQAGTDSQVAARLVDVAPDNTKVLVARGLWRPNPAGAANQDGFQVFQLHANGWTFQEGHVARLELLPKDANYGRPSNNQQAATVSWVDLRIPVVEQPGALGGLVKAPAKKVLPERAGAELARGYEAIGSQTLGEYVAERKTCPPGTTGTEPDCRPVANPVIGPLSLNGNPIVKGKVLIAKVRCQIGNDSCAKTSLSFKGAPKKGKKGKGLVIAKGRTGTATSGKQFKVTLPLTKAARKFFKDKKVRKKGKRKVKRGPNSLRAKATVNGKSAGFVTVKRVGKVK